MMYMILPLVTTAGEQVAALLVQNLVFVSVALWVWRRQKLSVGQVGLGRPTVRQVTYALGMGIGLFIVAVVAGGLLALAMQKLLPPATYAQLMRQHMAASAEGNFLRIGGLRWLQASFVFLGSVIAPLGEEAVFRGLIYRGLRQRYGVGAGLALSSAIFAIAHFSLLTFGTLFLIGLILALAYERTGSLWVPILMHCVNNLLMFMLLWQQTT